MEYKVKTVADAQALAALAHYGQMRRNGSEPYYRHVCRVGDAVIAMPNISLDAILAGYLHDVIEDTDVTAEQLLADGYTQRTVDLVVSLTRDADISYTDYIDWLIATGDVELMYIKLADLNDNSTIYPDGCWDGWMHSIQRYTRAKIKIVVAINQLLTVS